MSNIQYGDCTTIWIKYIGRWFYICSIDLKIGQISQKLSKWSDIGLRLYHIRSSSLTIFIVTVTVSAAEDLQDSGKRQRLSLKRKFVKTEHSQMYRIPALPT